MKPKAKALELIDKFYDVDIFDVDWGSSSSFDRKKCALIAVDEIIYYLEITLGVDKEDFKYWYEVKQEIEKL